MYSVEFEFTEKEIILGGTELIRQALLSQSNSKQQICSSADPEQSKWPCCELQMEEVAQQRPECHMARPVGSENIAGLTAISK